MKKNNNVIPQKETFEKGEILFSSKRCLIRTFLEKDMDDFSINALDPNGDAISYTLSGEDKDSFIEEDGI